MASEAELRVTPDAEILVVDRRGWISGNVRTLQSLFGDGLPGTDAKIAAWEGGAFLGLVARAVLAQYDPFRDVLVVVYPNLGSVGEGDALRWLMFHEVTHLAQFRSAPWIPDHITTLGRRVLGAEDTTWIREAARRMATNLPDLLRWARSALEGRTGGATPLLDFLPPEQRSIVMRLHGLLTLLEGHATYITDRIAARVIPNYDEMQRRVRDERKRPPWLRLLEAFAGLDLKREQYILGRGFCEAVWDRGGAAALAPVWRSPDECPTVDELRAPESWIARVAD